MRSPRAHLLCACAALVAAATALPARASASAAVEAPGPRPAAFLGAGGILPAGVRAVLLEADTELTGYPTFIVGVRRGFADRLELGIELGGIDVVFLGRLHAKVAFWEPASRAWFIGMRLRVDFKRHQQRFGEGVFRPIDDFGFGVVPALLASHRFGDDRAHALHYSVFYYFDIDVRPGHRVEHFLGPAVLGYEYRFPFGLHVQADVGVGFELLNPETAGEPIPKLQLVVGYEL